MAGILNDGMKTRPEISLVIPSYNRSASVCRLLQGLARQSANPELFEVVLVLDGCTDDSAVAARSAKLPYALIVVEQEGRGRAAARNHGVRKAAGDLILFLDDDMDADPGLVATHLAAHREHPGEVMLGYYPMPPEKDASPERERIKEWWDNQFDKRSQPGHEFTYHDFLTGNVSLSRDLLVRLYGFEESMPRIATCEDWELGLRLLKIGAKFRDLREAVCIHRTVASTKFILYRAREEGAGQAVMIVKHPEIFLDLPLSRSFWFLEKPSDWPVIRFLWRYPLIVNLVGTLVGRLYLLLAWLGLRRLQHFIEPWARQFEYWRGLRLVFSSASHWRATCLGARVLSTQVATRAATGLRVEESPVPTHASPPLPGNTLPESKVGSTR
jgi:GT2 family glycosyltransferase